MVLKLISLPSHLTNELFPSFCARSLSMHTFSQGRTALLNGQSCRCHSFSGPEISQFLSNWLPKTCIWRSSRLWKDCNSIGCVKSSSNELTRFTVTGPGSWRDYNKINAVVPVDRYTCALFFLYERLYALVSVRLILGGVVLECLN